MAYDLTPLTASIDTFEALAQGLTRALSDGSAIVDVNSYAKGAQQATDPLLAAATLMASYARAAIADLDARVTAAEAQGADHEARIAALENP